MRDGRGQCKFSAHREEVRRLTRRLPCCASDPVQPAAHGDIAPYRFRGGSTQPVPASVKNIEDNIVKNNVRLISKFNTLLRLDCHNKLDVTADVKAYYMQHYQDFILVLRWDL